MIGPPRPYEVFGRWNTKKPKEVIDAYDRLLPAYRWAKGVLVVGVGNGETARALREYHPEAKVTAIDCDRTKLIYEDRIWSTFVRLSDEFQQTIFANDNCNTFSVVACEPSHIETLLLCYTILRRTLRPNGVFIAEGVHNDHIPVLRAMGFDATGTTVHTVKREGY